MSATDGSDSCHPQEADLQARRCRDLVIPFGESSVAVFLSLRYMEHLVLSSIRVNDLSKTEMSHQIGLRDDAGDSAGPITGCKT